MSVIEEPFVRICVAPTTEIAFDVERPDGRGIDILFVVEHYKPSHSGHEFILVREIPMMFPFSSVKEQCYESFYRGLLRSFLSNKGIREPIHEEIFDKCFPVIEAAETYEVPIVVSIYDGGAQPLRDEEVSSFTPTAESAIEALEQGLMLP